MGGKEPRFPPLPPFSRAQCRLLVDANRRPGQRGSLMTQVNPQKRQQGREGWEPTRRGGWKIQRCAPPIGTDRSFFLTQINFTVAFTWYLKDHSVYKKYTKSYFFLLTTAYYYLYYEYIMTHITGFYISLFTIYIFLL